MEDGMGGLAETAPRVCRRELMGMVRWLIDCGRWLVLLRGVALLLAASSSVVAVVCRHAGRWSVALGWRWRTVLLNLLAGLLLPRSQRSLCVHSSLGIFGDNEGTLKSFINKLYLTKSGQCMRQYEDTICQPHKPYYIPPPCMQVGNRLAS
eukprot:scaffold967_cov196-Alexandrium_tamarense.AAC.2